MKKIMIKRAAGRWPYKFFCLGGGPSRIAFDFSRAGARLDALHLRTEGVNTMRITRSLAVLALVFAVSATAFAWAPGTHSYIANKLKPGYAVNTMFGATVPDINQLLSTQQDSPFFFATHYDFYGMWQAAELTPSAGVLPLAFGYLSHNEAWGADYYAHIHSQLYPFFENPDSRYEGQNGYVWVKAIQLCAVMKTQLHATGADTVLASALLSDPMNCHFIVEYAMDLQLKATRDPRIGQELLAAAANYDEAALQALFVAAYPGPTVVFPPPLGTVTLGTGLAAYQGAWASLMQMYAKALGKPTMKQAVPAVAEFLEMLAEQTLGDQIRSALGLGATDPIPDAVKLQLTKLIELGLTDSLFLCSYDYGLQLDLTTRAVRNNLAEHGVVF